MNIENTSLETLGLDNFDVTGDFNLEDIDNAIEQVSDSRASIGAQTNALRSNINSSQIARENTLAARSNLDEDFVQSINNLRKENLLNQYRINVQRLQQENEGSELSLLR
jgi:flagellin